ncbi:MAG: nitrilase, partial [Bacteroidales bacterium]|nr:nitrilase [Bacteroidales bacterium]
FDGPKGREWLMRWLPSRSHDNAIYAVFSNPIGMDDDQLKNGCSMILDPYGEVIAECRELGDTMVTAELTSDKLTLAGGYRYTNARRPELYSKVIGKEHNSEQKVAWMEQKRV